MLKVLKYFSKKQYLYSKFERMENLETLRASLVQKIFSTDNLNLLEAINQIFSSTEVEEKEYKLSENQKKLLMLAEDDIKYGRLVSDEELRKMDEEWMK